MSVLVPVPPVPDSDNDSEEPLTEESDSEPDYDPNYAFDGGIVEVVPVAEALEEGVCGCSQTDCDNIGGAGRSGLRIAKA